VNEPRDVTGGDVVSAYLDGELAPVELAAFEARLAADEGARTELADLAEVRTLVRELGPVDPPAGFVEELLAAGAADARAESEAASSAAAPVVPLEAERARRRSRTRFAALAAGAAAAVAFVVAVVVPGQHTVRPALATEVRVHQAGSAAAGDPVSGLAPLATPLRFGR
jgi:anti-sigma factor RsiW